MDKQELLKTLAFNVVQGRVEAEDEGFDEGLEGQPAVTELVEQGSRRAHIPRGDVARERLIGLWAAF